MQVSIIICTYNRGLSLRNTLESIKLMEVPDDLSWELVVVDNNSKDNTRSVFDEFKRSTDINASCVKEVKQGLSHARNRGIEVKRGEISVFTDDDVLVDKYWLANLVKAFKQYDAACIGGKILPVWEISPPGWLKKELHGHLALLDYGESVLEMQKPKLWGANFAVKSSLFRKYGTFNTSQGRTPNKLYGNEETEMIEKFIQGGERVLYCPEIIVHHCIPVSRMKKSYFRKWKYDQGELAARRSYDVVYKTIFGVPLVAIKSLLESCLTYLQMLITRPDTAFLQQLRVIYHLGNIMGKIKLNHNR